jgi:hypothetical protein
MDLEKYKKDVETAKKRSITSFANLAIKYALANNTVEVGGVIRDGSFAIKVEKIEVYRSEVPQCMYTGPRVNKDHELSECGRTETIYQNNIVN